MFSKVIKEIKEDEEHDLEAIIEIFVWYLLGII